MTDLDRIAERYRAAQAATAAKTALKVGQYWKGVEVGNEDSERNFVELAAISVGSGWRESTERTGNLALQRLDVIPEFVDPNEEQIRASLTYMGPVQARRHLRAGAYFEENFLSVDADEVREMMEARAAAPARARAEVASGLRGSAIRLTGVGSRQMSESIVAQSGTRIGYMRVTGADPCYFCVMLASRGPDFGDDSFDASDARFTGLGNAKVHDSCKCSLMLVTTADVDQLSQWREHEKTWAELSGKDPKDGESPVNTFRRNYEQLSA